MLFLVAATWLLAIVVLTAGCDATCRVHGVSRMGVADRTFLHYWVGSSALFAALCLFALLAPLNLFFWPALAYLAIRHRRAWRLAKDILSQAGWRWTSAFLLLQLAYAVKLVELTSNYDSYLYHYQLISWYGEYGAVKGLGLLHFRLAYSSAWYALAAAFEGYPFTGRAGNLPSFFVLSAGTAFILAIARKALSGKLDVPSRFWVYFFAGTVASMPVEVHSTSADFGAAVLIGAAAWALLVQPVGAVRSASYLAIPVFIASGATAVKQQAAFALAGLALYFVFRTRDAWRSYWRLGLACLPFAAVTLVNALTSGCLVTNLGGSCLDLPWAMSRWHMRDAGTAIRAFYVGDQFNRTAAFGQWLVFWVSREGVYTLLATLTVLGGAGMQFWPRKKDTPDRAGSLTLLAIGIAGSSFCAWAAPTLRFAVGYLWLAPALALATMGNGGTLLAALAICAVREWLPFGSGRVAPVIEVTTGPVLAGLLVLAAQRTAQNATRNLAVAAALIVTFVSGVSDFYRRPTHPRPDYEAKLRWLVPVRAPELKPNDLQYVVRPGFRMHLTKPPNLSCFAGNLPCSLYDDGLVLLSPDDGIGGGFTYGPDSPRYGERERSFRQ